MQSEKIIKIKKIGKKRAVDVEVDNDSHLFYGNGIATSNSHSISYATIGYQTAYAKTHFPKEFFCASLRYAHDKIKPKEEIGQLVNECKLYNIPINPPYLKNIAENRKNFYIIDNSIYFGVSDIKGFAEKEFDKLVKRETAKSDIWEEILFGFFDKPKIAKNAVEGLISSGGLDYCFENRQKMLYEYKILKDFTDKERAFLQEMSGSLTFRIEELIKVYKEYLFDKSQKEKRVISSKKRLEKIYSSLKLLKNPPRDLHDSEQVFLQKEKDLLGVPVTKSILCNFNTSLANCNCSNFNSGFDADPIIICGIIKRFNEYVVKQGKNAGKKMGFLEIEDDYGSINAVIFSKEYETLSHNFYEGNGLAFIGERLFSNPKDFNVKDVKNI